MPCQARRERRYRRARANRRANLPPRGQFCTPNDNPGRFGRQLLYHRPRFALHRSRLRATRFRGTEPDPSSRAHLNSTLIRITRGIRRSVGAEHAAVALERLQPRAATFAVLEELAGISRHRLDRLMAAFPACEFRLQVHDSRSVFDDVACLWASDIAAGRASLSLSLSLAKPQGFTHNSFTKGWGGDSCSLRDRQIRGPVFGS